MRDEMLKRLHVFLAGELYSHAWQEWEKIRAEIVAERCENCSHWGSTVMDGDEPAEAGWHYCVKHADGDRGLLARYDGGVAADEVCTAPDFCCPRFDPKEKA